MLQIKSNKPIITWAQSDEKSHINILGDKALIYENKEQEFNNVYSQYLEVIEKNAIPDDGSNVFAAVKYAKDNFSDKVGIFKKFVRNGWGAVKFNLS